MSSSESEPRRLARTFLEQTLAAEGDVLVLEHQTRAKVIESLTAVGDRSGSLAPRNIESNRATPVRGASNRAGSADGGSGSASQMAGVTVEAIASAQDLESLSRLVAACGRCSLHEVRKSAVFGEGASDARVVCVGEAPGAREDETGRPFVGRAGQLLDRMLQTIDLPRASVYICNVLKSRPPQNRDPLPEEVSACSPYLLRQLALIQPDVIVAFGAFAARTLLETKSALGRLRGRVHEYSGFPVVVTYHPAALLRNPGWVRPSWEDLQIVRRLLDEADANHEEHGG